MLSEAQSNDLVIVPTQSKDELRLSNGKSFDGLDKSWGNSRDWVLELRDGRQVVIPPSLYRSMESLTDFTGLEDDLNIKYGQGKVHLLKELLSLDWADESESGVAWDALSFNGGSEGELWENLK